MLEKSMDAIREATAFERCVLPNGLTVMVHSMPQFTGVHAIYGTKFGSIDKSFTVDGQQYDLPAGVAHFLEHKMFENKEGDAFTLYAKTGASANAYTGFDKTCYIFTASSQVEKNLDILLSFVSEPYFTKETIEKEQGIIGQEIKMYDDSADWRLAFAVYQCLYRNHGIRDDIAGSVDSIAQITPELLYTCADAFYRPQNMALAVAGNVTMQQVLDAVDRANIKEKTSEVVKLVSQEPKAVLKSHYEFKMPVAKPLLGLGFKESIPMQEHLLKQEFVCDIITELVCGSTTPLYRKLYDEALVSPDFSGEVLSVKGVLCIFFGGESSQPELVRELLLMEIARLRCQGVEEELFLLCKNLMYGELVQSLENIEDVAAGLFNAFKKDCTPAQEIEMLASITKQDIDAALQELLLEENSTTVIIRPEQGEEE